MRWKVVLRPQIDVADQRTLLAQLMHDRLAQRFPRFESRVSVTAAGLELELAVEAADDLEAKRKGQYACRRAAESARGVKWHTQPMERIEACPLG